MNVSLLSEKVLMFTVSQQLFLSFLATLQTNIRHMYVYISVLVPMLK